MRKRIYIAGPISKGDLAENVNTASAAFVTLAKAGLAPWCPHWSVFSTEPCEPSRLFPDSQVIARGTAMGHASMTHEDWLNIDLAWVAVTDALLRLPGRSVGADREVTEARRLGKPVFYTTEEAVRWAME